MYYNIYCMCFGNNYLFIFMLMKSFEFEREREIYYKNLK